MRGFLGVPLPAFDPLTRLVEELDGTGGFKVVDPAQFHLTVLFLGEVAEEQARTLVDLVRKTPLPPPFDLRVRDVGAFPGWKKLNVVWAGIEDASGGMSRLHDVSREAWVGLGGTSEERDYRPHLTLGRQRDDRKAETAREILTRRRGQEFGTARVDRVNLYRSTLGPQGPRYDVVEEVLL